MEIQKKKKERVVLALSTEQADELRGFLKRAVKPGNPGITHGSQIVELEKIYERIETTLNKQSVIKEFKKQGIIPSKEQIKKAMEVLK